MRRIKIKAEELVWNERNTEHIKKHDVTVEEIEEVFNKYVHMRKGHSRRLVVFGHTEQRRLLAIVIKKSNLGYYIFSARDASKTERKYI